MKNSFRPRFIIVFFVLCLSISFMQGAALAQEDGPSIGRPSRESKPDPPKRTPRRPRRPTNTTKNGVPKGKPLEFYVRSGSDLLDAGDYDQALLFFEEGEKRRRDRNATPELLELLDKQIRVAKLHIDADNFGDDETEKALANYEEILKLRPNDQRAREQILELSLKVAEDMLAAKEFERAVPLFEQLSTLSPDNNDIRAKLVSALVGRGEAEVQAGKEDLAQATFKRVLELDAKNNTAQARLREFDLRNLVLFAENKLKNGAFEDALNKFQEVLSLDPNNERAKTGLQTARANFQKQKADQLYNNRKYVEAEREYKEVAGLLPDNDDIKKRLEELSQRLGPSYPLRGKVTWRAKVAGPVKVAIKGKTLTYPDSSAQIDAILYEGLPEIPYLVKKVKKTVGGANVRIVEQPSAANGYATVVSVDAKKSDDVGFEVEWELKKSGRISWRGQVVGRSLIRVQGPFIDVEQISGEAPKDINAQIEPLPRQDTVLRLRKISGKADIRLIESPTAANLYIATIAVEGASESESDLLSFELDWALK